MMSIGYVNAGKLVNDDDAIKTKQDSHEMSRSGMKIPLPLLLNHPYNLLGNSYRILN